MGRAQDIKAALFKRGGEQISDIFESPAVSWKALFAWRCVVFAWVLGTFIWEATEGYIELQFFTQQNYTLLLILYAALVVCGVLRLQDLEHDIPEILAPMLTALVHIVAVNAIFLDVVFWALLFPSMVGTDMMTTSFMLMNVFNHAINFVPILLAEIFLANWALKPFYSFIIGFAYLLVYVFCVAWPYWAVTGQWVYSILDFEANGPVFTVIIYLGVCLWYFTAAGIVQGLWMLRNYMVKRGLLCFHKEWHPAESTSQAELLME